MASENTPNESPLPGLTFATSFTYFNDLCTEHLQGVSKEKREEIAATLHAGHYQKFQITLTGTVSKTTPDGQLTLLGQDIKAYGLRRELAVSNPFGKREPKRTKAEQRKTEAEQMKIWEERLKKQAKDIARKNGVGGNPLGNTLAEKTWEKVRKQAAAAARAEKAFWGVVERLGWIGVFVLGMAVGIVLGIEMCVKFKVVV